MQTRTLFATTRFNGTWLLPAEGSQPLVLLLGPAIQDARVFLATIGFRRHQQL